MSADLDDLFTALGRQADAIPLAGAEPARERGRRRRTRNRVVLAAAAVLLILTGAGLVVNRDRHAEPILPATTPARIRGLAPAGEPFRITDGRTWSGARISGNRVIGFSGDAEGRQVTAARDVTTGKTLWTLSDLAGPDRGWYRGMAATEDSVILLLELDGSTVDEPQDRILEFHDPQTGARRWELPHTTDDRLVLHEKVLARLIGVTGTIEGYDLITGERLWSEPGSGDPPRMITGMRAAGDPDEAGGLFDPSSEKVYPVTDDRLILASAGGRIETRNIHTGKILAVNRGRPGIEDLSAYEGRAYVTEPNGVGSPAGTLYRPPPPWSVTRSFGCGTDRLCVFEQNGASARLTLLAEPDGTVLRTTAAVPLIGFNATRLGHVFTSGGGDKGTALYDENGEVRYSDNGIGGFVDDGNVLTLTRDAGDGRFTARGVSNIDFQKVTLGTVPEISGRCDWNAELLTCPAGKQLWIWRFTR
ncbi:hypothetical protein [Actinoplanes derwentensis]|uniref:PQQ-like domain-containing protein n=1 Tax=Actinoplanes derwentensis TaxID=113562 RepID=A0A1H2D4K4_9ACTN|nr:hypothetical protein [Actinoplanes derwentensis]GID85424.1 hypothetical protein Ade03nite_43480 [Actinoplanes derwentensis]SDT77681.1 hypothetical protein SAMN04489716_8060 [Actinoplanes derwentensis]